MTSRAMTLDQAGLREVAVSWPSSHIQVHIHIHIHIRINVRIQIALHSAFQNRFVLFLK